MYLKKTEIEGIGRRPGNDRGGLGGGLGTKSFWCHVDKLLKKRMWTFSRVPGELQHGVGKLDRPGDSGGGKSIG